MKILVVSSYLPFPLFSGGHIRLYNLLKHLSKNHEITLICEKRIYQTDKDIKELEKICKKVVVVERKKQWTFSNIVKTGFSTDPFLIKGHTSDTFKKAIKAELLNQKFDLIHVETFYVMQNLPWVSTPVVLAEHNIEYLVYKRYSQNASSFLKPLFYLDVYKLKRAEEKSWGKATKLVAVSNEEKKLMNRSDTAVVPNGVDVDKFKLSDKASTNQKRVLFIGDFKWIQNKDSAEFILKHVWPKIQSGIRNQKLEIKVKLWIVGKDIPQNIKNLGDEDVIFDEKAPEETSLIFQNADVLLAPIRVGGGTSFKILEAMATGTAVVTTDLGIEGIDAKDNEEFLLANTSEEMVQSTVRVLTDSMLKEKIVKNARLLMKEKYDWKKIVLMLESVYRSAVKND